ncbi:LysM peptidoglycan-binding domain-containing protein [Paenibacillus cymbidii]|uniref:LysM peptidoglycan-binding domain-containing protein n=1 Tax=Paenibacillus cymbidii TaxID=1639034 RepID=UPI001080993D|nr:LysM peptidoglycan-binding domain-containing protein [Paenibacillus cymbidii]
MTEQQAGLRFDIYERVHLPEGFAGIRELDEVELLPHIQVHDDGEQTLLRGHLWLTGKYVGEDDSPGCTLEHYIPVEITLPKRRVRQVESIAVEIDNFDIDLLDNRSMNVTGVLSLRGIEMLSGDRDAWLEDEEVVFEHRAQEPTAVETPPVYIAPLPGASNDLTPSPGAPYRAPDAAFYAPSQPLGRQLGQPPQAWPPQQANWPPAQSAWPPHDVQEEPAIPAAQAAPSFEPEPEPEPSFDLPADDFREEATVQTPYVPFAADPAIEAQANETVAADAKKEMRIAFGSKPGDAADSIKSLSSLLPGGFADSRRLPEQPSAAEAQPADASRPEQVEWKKLFLGSAAEERPFRKMRICIVQREETIDSIAARYRLNAREILLHNRLSQSDVAEGQILYIPG